jgi:hypothetical protein
MGMMTIHFVVGSTLAILYAVSIHPTPNDRLLPPYMLGKPQRRDLPVQTSKSRDRSRKLYPFKSSMLAFFLSKKFTAEAYHKGQVRHSINAVGNLASIGIQSIDITASTWPP